ncbi:hypothetical protein N7467_002268 [Penicillium canescens]|nr:hypothetical protein N7467_002268 [Penicillium canescens]
MSLRRPLRWTLSMSNDLGSNWIPTPRCSHLEPRRLHFDSEDTWNQTMADNPEWFAIFRNDRYNDSLFQTPDEFLDNVLPGN